MNIVGLPNKLVLIHNKRGWQIQAFYPRVSGRGIGSARVLLAHYDSKWIIKSPWWKA